MGGVLEIGKLSSSVWLHKYWKRVAWTFKIYLIPAIGVLMLITSMGSYGYLAKAHSEQSAIIEEVQAKLQIFDDKIAAEQQLLDSAKKDMAQLDASVDQILTRSSDEKGAAHAAALRSSQDKDRRRLNANMQLYQANITALKNDRAPVASQVRKAEVEVGPIKYIADIIYGTSATTEVLERSVRWVIIMLVFVFDPLALFLVIAADQTFEWLHHDKKLGMEFDPIDGDPEPTPAMRRARERYDALLAEKQERERVIDNPPHEPSPAELVASEQELRKRAEEQATKLQEQIAKDFEPGGLIDQITSDLSTNLPMAEILPELSDEELAKNDSWVSSGETVEEPVKVPESRDDIDFLMHEWAAMAGDDEDEEDAGIRAEWEAMLGGGDTVDNTTPTTVRVLEQHEIDSLLGFDQSDEDYYEEEICPKCGTQLELAAGIGEYCPNADCDVNDNIYGAIHDMQEGNEKEISESIAAEPKPYDYEEFPFIFQTAQENYDDILEYQQPVVADSVEDLNEALKVIIEKEEQIARLKNQIKNMTNITVTDHAGNPVAVHFDEVIDLPDFAITEEDTKVAGNANFGTAFPNNPRKGDLFLRVDTLPNKLYKWNDQKWIEADPTSRDQLVSNDEYIKHLIEKLSNGEYELDDLTVAEQDQISKALSDESIN